MPCVILLSGVKFPTSTRPSLPFNRIQRMNASISLFRHAWSKDKGGVGIVGCCNSDDVEKFLCAHAFQFEPLIRDKCRVVHNFGF